METARTAPSSYPSAAGNGGYRQGNPNSADRLFLYSARKQEQQKVLGFEFRRASAI